jgi:hypothetical protein
MPADATLAMPGSSITWQLHVYTPLGACSTRTAVGSHLIRPSCCLQVADRCSAGRWEGLLELPAIRLDDEALQVCLCVHAWEHADSCGGPPCIVPPEAHFHPALPGGRRDAWSPPAASSQQASDRPVHTISKGQRSQGWPVQAPGKRAMLVDEACCAPLLSVRRLPRCTSQRNSPVAFQYRTYSWPRAVALRAAATGVCNPCAFSLQTVLHADGCTLLVLPQYSCSLLFPLLGQVAPETLPAGTLLLMAEHAVRRIAAFPSHAACMAANFMACLAEEGVLQQRQQEDAVDLAILALQCYGGSVGRLPLTVIWSLSPRCPQTLRVGCVGSGILQLNDGRQCTARSADSPCSGLPACPCGLWCALAPNGMMQQQSAQILSRLDTRVPCVRAS